MLSIQKRDCCRKKLDVTRNDVSVIFIDNNYMLKDLLTLDSFKMHKSVEKKERTVYYNDTV
jgi:hypothetical protein